MQNNQPVFYYSELKRYERKKKFYRTPIDFKVPHYAIFTNSYWLGKSRRNISDHYPVMVKLTYSQAKTKTR